MKKCPLFFLCFFVTLITFCSSLYAQTDKGKFYVGGSTNMMFSFQKFETKNNLEVSNYNISPSLGIFLMKNLLTGFEFSYSYEESKSSSSTEQNQIPSSSGFINIPVNYQHKLQEKTYLTSFFLKYYIDLSNASPLKLTINSQVGFGENISKDIWLDLGSTNKQEFIYTYKLGGGLSYFFKQMISLDVNVLYFTEYIVPSEKGSIRDKSKVSGFEPSMGLSFYF